MGLLPFIYVQMQRDRTAVRNNNTQGSSIIRWFGKSSAEAEIRTGLPDLYPRLWRFCLAQTGRRDQADDLAQKTCLRALEKHQGYQTGTHLDRWLFRMAHRLWLNELRATAVRVGGGLVALSETELPDEKPDSETNILARQVFERVGALPETQRVTVLLVYVEGFAYKEAAEILGIPIGTVMSRLAAARRKIAEDMAETETGT